MRWNWQHPDWPRFRWEAGALLPAELAFANHAGVLVGSTAHLNGDDRGALIVELMSRSALDSSAIEGEALDRSSVQSSVRRHLGLQDVDELGEARSAGPAEAGIARLMVEVFHDVNAALTEGALFQWHRWLMTGRGERLQVGGWRLHTEPMQIVSGPDYRRQVHFEAPPSAAVPGAMREFLRWYAATAPGGEAPLPALTRAGLAHLWFESLHPFEDGNGRLGRVIAEKALAQGRGSAMLTGIASVFMQQRKQYYAQLQAASHDLEVDAWLAWFAQQALQAQQQTLAWVQCLLAKTRLMDRLAGQLNARQEKALLRMYRAGPMGFEGGMSAGKYSHLTGASSATATRDLARLVALGALVRRGLQKGARYELADLGTVST